MINLSVFDGIIMNPRLFLCLLVLVAVEVQYTCSISTQTHVIGRLTHNASGHWLASATLRETDHTARDSVLELEVIPSVQRLNGVRMQSITVIVSGNALPPAPGYKKTNVSNSYYKVHEEKKNWVQAKNICEAENAHLLILNSKDEAEDIKKLLAQYPNFSDYFPVGIVDKDKDGTWLTIFGETLAVAGYSTWDASQPDAHKSRECGYVKSPAMALHNWTCDIGTSTFVCEQIS